MKLKLKIKRFLSSFNYIRKHNIEQEFLNKKLSPNENENLEIYKRLVFVKNILILRDFLINLITFYLIGYGIALNFIIHVLIGIPITIRYSIAFGLVWYLVTEDLFGRIKKVIR